jgi:SMC interacting uncharacterized protein involved in chromosome segregation
MDFVKVPSEPTVSDRIDAELRAQGGVVASLMDLVGVIKEASREVGLAIRGVAMDIDQERRGADSALSRQDCMQVAQDVERRIDGAIVNEQHRALMLRDLLDELAKKLGETSAEARAGADEIREQRRQYQLTHPNREQPSEIERLRAELADTKRRLELATQTRINMAQTVGSEGRRGGDS